MIIRAMALAGCIGGIILGKRFLELPRPGLAVVCALIAAALFALAVCYERRKD